MTGSLGRSVGRTALGVGLLGAAAAPWIIREQHDDNAELGPPEGARASETVDAHIANGGCDVAALADRSLQSDTILVALQRLGELRQVAGDIDLPEGYQLDGTKLGVCPAMAVVLDDISLAGVPGLRNVGDFVSVGLTTPDGASIRLLIPANFADVGDNHDDVWVAMDEPDTQWTRAAVSLIEVAARRDSEDALPPSTNYFITRSVDEPNVVTLTTALSGPGVLAGVAGLLLVTTNVVGAGRGLRRAASDWRADRAAASGDGPTPYSMYPVDSLDSMLENDEITHAEHEAALRAKVQPTNSSRSIPKPTKRSGT